MKHHGVFQGVYWFHHVGADPNARDRYADHPWYQACVDFCADYDQNSFDPGYPSEGLEFVEPMVRRVFHARSRPRPRPRLTFPSTMMVGGPVRVRSSKRTAGPACGQLPEALQAGGPAQ